MKQKLVTVFGGSGFLGKYVVQELAEAGYRVKVASRDPEEGKDIKVVGKVGQIAFISASIRDDESVARAVEGSWAVINLVGILYAKRKQNFSAIHAQGAERLAKAAKAAGAEAFIQVSALGVDKASRSRYARSKLNGEKAVATAFPGATILRPSVLFGAEDHFLNQFALMAKFSPCLPLIGGGHTKFQPVYAADVARAMVRVLEEPELRGETYELGGPNVYTFRQILEYILQETRQNSRLVHVPFSMATILGAFMELLPIPPLTRDQVELLKTDNIVSEEAKTFAELGIAPNAMEAVAPAYLAAYRKQQPQLRLAGEA